MSEPQKFDGRAIIQQLWNGQVPLFQTFWLYYFAVIAVLHILAGVLGFMAPILILLKIIWAGFMIKPIWLAADKYAGEKIWATLAKIFAILIGLGVLSDLLYGMAASV